MADNLPLEGIKILVVDDERDILDFIVASLAERGAAAIGVETAAEALDHLVRDKPKVLVTDISMPGEDGFSLIRKVRSLSAEDGGQSVAIAITGVVSADIRLKYLQSGFQAYVIKPFDPEELVLVIRNWARG